MKNDTNGTSGASMRAKAPPRKERERLQHRGEILDAALRLFVQKGYHEVSMREIAEASEFATGTLYKFFDSKEALYRELVKTHARRIAGAILSSLEAPVDEREKIARYIRAHVQVLADNAPAVQLYYRQAQDFAAHFVDQDDEVRTVSEAALRKLTTVLSAGMRKGLFRRTDARRAAVSLTGVLQALTVSNLESLATSPTADLAAFAEDLFFRGLHER